MNLVFQSRRAVSPVIAAILLIVLTIAGTTVLIAVMSNIEESSPEFDTTNASIGSDTTEIPDLSMDIVKFR
ncbi:MAG: type IV pilin, partial [Candidatus Heimdallarchaeota archaeon]|nr:type IV pilin [Candidatus Heimdallarchaeota archaeon]